jgi:hypothetical protein
MALARERHHTPSMKAKKNGPCCSLLSGKPADDVQQAAERIEEMMHMFSSESIRLQPKPPNTNPTTTLAGMPCTQ